MFERLTVHVYSFIERPIKFNEAIAVILRFNGFFDAMMILSFCLTIVVVSVISQRKVFTFTNSVKTLVERFCETTLM